MYLANTAHTLEIVETEGDTANSPFTVNWRDCTTSNGGNIGVGTANGQTNGTTPVTVMSPPTSGRTREVVTFNYYNADNVTHNVTVRINEGSSVYRNQGDSPFVVPSMNTLRYSHKKGWYLIGDVAANEVYAGPATGTSGSAGFRKLNPSDLPALPTEYSVQGGM